MNNIRSDIVHLLLASLDALLFSMMYDMLAVQSEQFKSNAEHILTFLG